MTDADNSLDDPDVWYNFVMNIGFNPMCDPASLAVKVGADPHYAIAKIATYFHAPPSGLH